MTDWLTAFAGLTQSLKTPDLFKRWSGVFTLGAAMQRRVWLLSDSREVFPNLYVFLCAPPATGKGVALDPCTDLLTSLEDHFVGTRSMTAAALADEINEATVSIFVNGEGVQFNPLTIISDELGVFLPVYDAIMMSRLTDVYDCKGYSERTRGGDRITVDKAHLSLIAGCTPARLQNMLPDGAWNEGFMSRVILVYGSFDENRMISEERSNYSPGMFNVLRDELISRTSRYGRVRWSAEGLEAANVWMRAKMAPRPQHPKLVFYNGRRHWNFMKLVLIFCISRNGDLVNADDVLNAQDLLLETETYMSDAFKAMRSGGDQEVMEELYHWLYTLGVKDNQPRARMYLVRFLAERVPAHAIERIILAMLGGGMITEEQVKNIGPCYRAAKLDIE